MSGEPTPDPLGELVPEHGVRRVPARHRQQRFPLGPALPAIGLTCAAFAVAGVVAGLVWARLGIRGEPIEAFMYDGEPIFTDEVTAARLFAMDGTFAVVGAATGLMLGAALYMAFRRHGPWIVGALAVGSVLGGLVAFTVGTLVANDQLILAWEPTADQGATVNAPLTLHAYGVVAAWPVAAMVAVLVLAWFVGPDRGDVDDTDRVVHRFDRPGSSRPNPVR